MRTNLKGRDLGKMTEHFRTAQECVVRSDRLKFERKQRTRTSKELLSDDKAIFTYSLWFCGNWSVKNEEICINVRSSSHSVSS